MEEKSEQHISNITYVSFGRHCDIAYNINKYRSVQKKWTHFFDWCRTDFEVGVDIMSLENICDVFNKHNIICDHDSYKNAGNIAITFKNYSENGHTFLLRHDIPFEEYSESQLQEQLDNLIEKYKRRHNRLIDLIKSDSKIVFIHKYNVTYDNIDYYINKFTNSIDKINCRANYNLVLLANENKDYRYIIKKKCILINILHFENKEINDNDWTEKRFDWDKIFKIIDFCVEY